MLGQLQYNRRRYDNQLKLIFSLVVKNIKSKVSMENIIMNKEKPASTYFAEFSFRIFQIFARRIVLRILFLSFSFIYIIT